MIGWLARMALLRILPRKLLPILTVVEVARFLRSANRQRAANASGRAGQPGVGGGGRPVAPPGARVVGSSGPLPNGYGDRPPSADDGGHARVGE